MPLVSVIIPFLDPNEEFFRQAIASVQAQTLKDWELVLVDDGYLLLRRLGHLRRTCGC